MEDTIKIRKDKIKNVAIVFLSGMLVLTFFSNSILNRALPEVATAYVQYNTGSPALLEIAANIAEGDYSQPTAIYSLTPPEDAASVWDASLQDLEELSATLRDAILQKNLGPALINRINAMSGAETLALTAVCTAGKTFVCKGAEGSVTYLYVYENGYPAAVSFSEGENKAYSASGTFLINDRLDVSSQEAIASFFEEFGMEVGTVPLT